MTLPAHDLHGDDDQRPDVADFESFFERWYPSVLSYARRFGAAYAEEVAQETLFRAFSCFSDLSLDMPLPWLRRVARNIACDMHRSGRRLWPLPEPGETDPEDPGDGPEESVLRLERVRHMRAALSDISAEDRQLLHMLVVDESSVAEVADQLDVTANTVRVRLHRARRRLGDHYVRRAGHRVLAFPPLVLLALRRLLRPSATTATRSAPALAAVAALGGLTAATVVLSQPDLPRGSWSAASAEQQAYRHPAAPAVRLQPAAPHSAAAAPRTAAHAATAPTRGATVDGPQIGATLSNHPFAPGEDGHEYVVLDTPVGRFKIDQRETRSKGDGIICGRVDAVHCS